MTETFFVYITILLFMLLCFAMVQYLSPYKDGMAEGMRDIICVVWLLPFR